MSTVNVGKNGKKKYYFEIKKEAFYQTPIRVEDIKKALRIMFPMPPTYL